MEIATATSTALSEPSGLELPELAGLSGGVQVMAGDKIIGVLRVDASHLRLTQDDGPAQGRLLLAREEDFRKIIRGELNVVVAALQSRLAIEGDLVLATRVVLGLAAAGGRSPAADTTQPAADAATKGA